MIWSRLVQGRRLRKLRGVMTRTVGGCLTNAGLLAEHVALHSDVTLLVVSLSPPWKGCRRPVALTTTGFSPRAHYGPRPHHMMIIPTLEPPPHQRCWDWPIAADRVVPNAIWSMFRTQRRVGVIRPVNSRQNGRSSTNDCRDGQHCAGR